MIIKYSIYAIVLGITILLSFGIANAIPTTGDATDITSNNFTVPIAGASGDTWVAWGQYPGYLSWGSGIETEPDSITVYGAPILGGTTIYYKACDGTGCGAEKSLAIPAITTIPTPTFGAAYRNLSNHHFAITSIPPLLPTGYLATGVPAVLLWSLLFFFVGFGYWFRTRSVRLPLIMAFLLAAFVVSPLSGLYLGTVIAWQAVAAGLMAAMMAGIFLSFIRK